MVYIILGRGFEEVEAIAPYDMLNRAGVPVCFAGIGEGPITGGHGINVVPECRVEDIDLEGAELVVVPGGLGGVASIRSCPAAMDAVKGAYNAGVRVAAICAGPTVLAELGITDGKKATCYPGMENEMGSAVMQIGAPAVTDGIVTTGKSAGTATDFALELVRVLRGDEAAEKIRAAIHYERG